MKLILLDLNYTLVTNSDQTITQPMLRRIEIERYDLDLIASLRERQAAGVRVAIVTARPVRWREPSLSAIRQLTRWEPDLSYFNETNERPPEWKARVVTGLLARGEYVAADLFGIESNPRTRAAYARLGVKSCPKEEWRLS